MLRRNLCQRFKKLRGHRLAEFRQGSFQSVVRTSRSLGRDDNDGTGRFGLFDGPKSHIVVFSGKPLDKLLSKRRGIRRRETKASLGQLPETSLQARG